MWPQLQPTNSINQRNTELWTVAVSCPRLFGEHLCNSLFWFPEPQLHWLVCSHQSAGSCLWQVLSYSSTWSNKPPDRPLHPDRTGLFRPCTVFVSDLRRISVHIKPPIRLCTANENWLLAPEFTWISVFSWINSLLDKVKNHKRS